MYPEMSLSLASLIKSKQRDEEASFRREHDETDLTEREPRPAASTASRRPHAPASPSRSSTMSPHRQRKRKKLIASESLLPSSELSTFGSSIARTRTRADDVSPHSPNDDDDSSRQQANSNENDFDAVPADRELYVSGLYEIRDPESNRQFKEGFIEHLNRLLGEGGGGERWKSKFIVFKNSDMATKAFELGTFSFSGRQFSLNRPRAYFRVRDRASAAMKEASTSTYPPVHHFDGQNLSVERQLFVRGGRGFEMDSKKEHELLRQVNHDMIDKGFCHSNETPAVGWVKMFMVFCDGEMASRALDLGSFTTSSGTHIILERPKIYREFFDLIEVAKASKRFRELPHNDVSSPERQLHVRLDGIHHFCFLLEAKVGVMEYVREALINEGHCSSTDEPIEGCHGSFLVFRTAEIVEKALKLSGLQFKGRALELTRPNKLSQPSRGGEELSRYSRFGCVTTASPENEDRESSERHVVDEGGGHDAVSDTLHQDEAELRSPHNRSVGRRVSFNLSKNSGSLDSHTFIDIPNKNPTEQREQEPSSSAPTNHDTSITSQQQGPVEETSAETAEEIQRLKKQLKDLKESKNREIEDLQEMMNDLDKRLQSRTEMTSKLLKEVKEEHNARVKAESALDTANEEIATLRKQQVT